MSRRLRALLFLAGAGVFVWLIARAGPRQLATDLATLGWRFLVIVLLHAAVYALNAAAQHVLLASESRRPRFPQTFAITVASFGINYVTPIVNMGGEPYRAAALGRWLGVTRAIGAVILYYLVHAASNVVLWIVALALALHYAPERAALVLPALALALAAAGILALALRGTPLRWLVDQLCRLPLPHVVTGALQKRRPDLIVLDTHVAAFGREQPRQLALAVGFDLASRAVGVLELMVMGAAVGMAVSFGQALVAGGLGSLVVNVLFVVPFEMGTREGSLVASFALAGLNPALGVYAGVVTRLRELTWIGIGFGLLAGLGGPAAVPLTPTRSSRAASSSRRTPLGSPPAPRS